MARPERRGPTNSESIPTLAYPGNRERSHDMGDSDKMEREKEKVRERELACLFLFLLFACTCIKAMELCNGGIDVIR